MKFENEDRKLLEELFQLCEVQPGINGRWHPHRRLLNRLLNSTVEEAALRAERVQLQDENLGLREELKKVDSLERQLMALAEKAGSTEVELHNRIDKVVDIIGERVSGLVDEIAAVRDSAKRAHERVDDLRGLVGGDRGTEGYASIMARLDELENPPVVPKRAAQPAFPTGGASTAETAAEAVLPVPQRGDRVRLEGAQSVGHTGIGDGWYDVLGQDAQSFQIRFSLSGAPATDIVGASLFWIDNNHPGLKEVRHADQR